MDQTSNLPEKITFYQIKDTRVIDGETWHLIRWEGWWDPESYRDLFKEIMQDTDRAQFDIDEKKIYIRDDYLSVIDEEILSKYWYTFHPRDKEKVEKIKEAFSKPPESQQ